MANDLSPTQRSLKHLRENGYRVEIVEHWNQWAGQRKDLWGCIDLLGIHEVSGDILAVQTTTGSNMAARVKKITNLDILPLLRRANITVHVHGWSKLKSGWTLRTEDLS